jgi:hypothetical protein
MKKNLVRIIVALLLASVWGYYIYWNYERITYGPMEQEINCVNNLKQIGLTFRLWEIDHGDQYPFNVSTNAGGTMEFCAVDKDGFDRNSFLHFKAMTGDDYLRVPLLLVCPQDGSKRAATNWASLGPENVTYRLRSGTNISDTNPHTILAVCPIDGNVLYCDGTVLDKNGKTPQTPKAKSRYK